MTTLLPQDSDNNPIPVLRLQSSKAHQIAITGSSASNATAFDAETRVISIYSDVDLFINFGDNGVSATTSDHFFPAKTYYDLAIGGGRTGQSSHIAVISNGTDGTLYISEKQ